VLPPFFFKDVTDEGIYAAYAELIDGVGDNRLRLHLYHIPQVSGVGLSVAMVSRLAAAYPAIVAGVKDSSGSFETRALVAALPQLSFRRPRAASAGVAQVGTCSERRRHEGSRNEVLVADTALTPVEVFICGCVLAIAVLMRFPIFGALKSLQAGLSGEESWRALRAPLLPLSAADARALDQAVAAAGIVPERDGAGATLKETSK
jgi:4-hydroxy-tetrahydrodipicolinate synthase